jgi:uncharacterized protein YcsI (UPF0317 family)
MSIAAVEGNEIPFFDQPRDLRRAIREGDFEHYTVGQVPGYVHTNICILPLDYAYEFQTFCQRNPRPCPLLAMSAPGDPALPELGEDIDIRTDVPQYRIFRDGQFVEDVSDIRQLWRDDMVTFAMGCSLSFEEALIEGGLPLRHFDNRENVPIYLTDIDCKPAGRFAGKLVVSMRPFSPADAIRAIQITTRFPGVHGAPVHIGRPDLIGIDDVNQSWQCGTPDIRDDEIPVFWACGVTPQSVVEQAKPPICITHKPACMLVTDLRNAELAAL